ncbi:hypothetical protein DTO217A2_7774 [Paecilomyces variotii]|nr:hypothetical protein DTO217A2_7774 [Paecilomyces variotii]KAJ9367215.1 hypothetical protein DTO282E5_8063 [Paecilomyces variotii]
MGFYLSKPQLQKRHSGPIDTATRDRKTYQQSCSGLSVFDSLYSTKSLMPVTHAHDPLAREKEDEHPTFPLLSFIWDPESPPEYPEDEDAIKFLPLERGFQWVSQLPGCRQSKHWGSTKKVTMQFLDEIHTSMKNSVSKLPEELQQRSDNIEHAKKEQDLIETAVRSTTHMMPDASAVRSGIIAQSMLIIFLHDDVVEPDPSQAGHTVADEIMHLWRESTDRELQIPEATLQGGNFLHSFTKRVLAEDPISGKELLKGAYRWVVFTRGYKTIPPSTFESLRSYLDYRDIDIGNDLLLGQVAFACDVRFCEEDKAILRNLIRLWEDHISLVNDLYSFHKEYEKSKSGWLILNAIDVIRKTNRVSTFTAKKIAREIIFDLEIQFYKEFKRLLGHSLLNSCQEKLAKGIAKCMAGHVYYSVTNPRYTGPGTTVFNSTD